MRESEYVCLVHLWCHVWYAMNILVYNRRYISRGGIAVGVGFGLVTGTFLGFIRST